MGVLTDFVIAHAEDAQRVGDSDCPSEDFGGLDAKGIDVVKLGTLHAILNGTEYDPTFDCPLLYSPSEDGPWVFQVPEDLVHQLANASDTDLPRVAEVWASTEEFCPPYGNWSSEEVRQVLEELAALCRKAVAEGKELLMWASL